MPKKDYYKILQVDPSAEPEVIQVAFLKLQFKYHPDRNKSPDAVEKSQEINEANDVLKDPQKRHKYDEERLNQSYYSGNHSQTSRSSETDREKERNNPPPADDGKRQTPKHDENSYQNEHRDSEKNEPEHYKPSENVTRSTSLNLENKGGIFRLLFSPKGRISRGRFFFTAMVLYLSNVIFLSFIEWVIFPESETWKPILFILVIPMAFSLTILTIKRFHDLGKSGWNVLSTFIPFIGFFIGIELIFGQGEAGLNEYGEKP